MMIPPCALVNVLGWSYDFGVSGVDGLREIQSNQNAGIFNPFPGVIKFKFRLQLPQKYNIAQNEELVGRMYVFVSVTHFSDNSDQSKANLPPWVTSLPLEEQYTLPLHPQHWRYQRSMCQHAYEAFIGNQKYLFTCGFTLSVCNRPEHVPSTGTCVYWPIRDLGAFLSIFICLRPINLSTHAAFQGSATKRSKSVSSDMVSRTDHHTETYIWLAICLWEIH